MLGISLKFLLQTVLLTFNLGASAEWNHSMILSAHGMDLPYPRDCQESGALRSLVLPCLVSDVSAFQVFELVVLTKSVRTEGEKHKLQSSLRTYFSQNECMPQLKHSHFVNRDMAHLGMGQIHNYSILSIMSKNL